jgi:hypothetical protein
MLPTDQIVISCSLEILLGCISFYEFDIVALLIVLAEKGKLLEKMEQIVERSVLQASFKEAGLK